MTQLFGCFFCSGFSTTTFVVLSLSLSLTFGAAALLLFFVLPFFVSFFFVFGYSSVVKKKKKKDLEIVFCVLVFIQSLLL